MDAFGIMMISVVNEEISIRGLKRPPNESKLVIPRCENLCTWRILKHPKLFDTAWASKKWAKI